MLSRKEILAEIEKETEPAKLSSLNTKLSAVTNQLNSIPRYISSVAVVVEQINKMENPSEILVNCKSDLESSITSLKDELMSLL